MAVVYALEAAAVPVSRLLEARELLPAAPGFCCGGLAGALRPFLRGTKVALSASDNARLSDTLTLLSQA